MEILLTEMEPMVDIEIRTRFGWAHILTPSVITELGFAATQTTDSSAGAY